MKVGRSFSSYNNVISGVPQGSVLGPLLFLLYINDIVDVFGSGLKVKLYADDVKIYIHISDVTTAACLQAGLDKLCEWADVWQLNLSINKCSVFHIGSYNVCSTYTVNNIVLPDVDHVTDLGIIFDSRLRFNNQYSNIVAKAHRRAALILRCFKSRDPFLLFKAFKTYVIPILEYCSPVWSPVYLTDIRTIESVQRRFTKKLSGLRDISYNQRLSYLNAESLERRRLNQDLATIYKIIYGLIDIPVDDFFEYSSEQRTRGNSRKLITPLCKLNIRKHSFACRNITSWNNLPDYIVCASNLSVFKKYLSAFNMTKFLTCL